MTTGAETPTPAAAPALDADARARGQVLLHIETVGAVLQGQLLNGLGYVAFYTKVLRASDQQIGLLTAVPSLAQLLQMLVAPRTARMERGKALVVVTGALAGIVGSLAAAIPFVLPPDRRIPSLIVLAGIASCIGALGAPLFNAWFANLLPDRDRGRYLATRYIAQSVVVLAATWLIGQYLEHMSGPYTYAILFGLGAVVAVAGRWVLWAVPDATRSGIEAGESSWHAALTVPLRYPAFMRFAWFYVLWIFAAFLSAPFQQVFLIRVLQVPLDRIGLLTAISTACTLATYRYWGAAVDRNSNRAVLRLAIAAIVLIQFAFLFAAPGSYGVLYPITVLGGFANAAIAVTVNNLFYSVYPSGDDKVTVAGFYAALVGVASFLAPIAGGQLASLTERVAFHAGPVTIDRYRVLFLVTAALWMVALPLLSRVPERGSAGLRSLVADLVAAAREAISGQ